MVGMADGFAQASGKTTVVNLHTAPGVGNAMGAIFNAQANHSPLLVTAGQQARAQITLQANLTNRDATRMPHPLVKWSYEPPRAEDVPLALAHGAHLAGLPPRGPVFVSLPMDDWGVEVDDGDARAAIDRKVTGRATADPEAVRALAARARRRHQPGPRRRPRHRRQRRLGPRHRPRRAPAAAGLGLAGDRRQPPRLPREPPQLPRRAAAGDRPGRADARGPRPDPRRRQLGLPLLPVHPGAAAARGGEAGGDHQRPRRGGAGADGRRDRRRRQAHAWRRCWRRSPSPRARCRSRTRARGEIPPSDPLNPSTVHTALAEVLPEDAIVVLESPSSTLALRNQLRISRPGSYYFSAGGGLGFGLAASVGVQLAQPNRPVVCVLGEGSAQYAITAFWSAVAYDTPVTFLVLRNEEYAILKWFAEVEQVSGAPGLDLPKLDVAAVAEGYGVKAHRAKRPRRSPRRPRRRPRLLQAGAGRSPGRARACHSSRRTMALLERSPQSLAPQVDEPAPDRAPDAIAAGVAQPLRGELEALLGADRVLAKAGDIVKYASDASPYRLFPQAVVMARDAGDVAKVLAYGREQGHPGHLPRRRHQPQRPGPERRHPRRRAPPLRRRRGRGGRRARPGQARHRARPRQPRARPARAQARPRPGQHRHRLRRRRHRQQLGRDALRHHQGLLLDRARDDPGPALGDDDRHRRARRRGALRRGRAGAGRRAWPRSATRSAPTRS